MFGRVSGGLGSGGCPSVQDRMRESLGNTEPGISRPRRSRYLKGPNGWGSPRAYVCIRMGCMYVCMSLYDYPYRIEWLGNQRQLIAR